MDDLVTLSMPVYNGAPFVERALRSALNQTFENIEFLLVDDRGDDDSMDIIRRVVAQHPRGKDVRIIEHPVNTGLGATRNTAIDHASGKYLFFMDSDDEITEDAIEKLYRAMQETPVDVTAGSVEKRERNGNVRMRRIYPDETVAGMLAMGYKHYSSRNRETVVWNKLYLLSFLKKHNIKCIDNQLYEDAVFTCQVVLNASSYKYIPDITYIHYDTDNSGMDRVRTKRVSLRASKEYLEIINFTKKYLDHYTDMRLRELVFRSLIFTIVLSVALVSDSVLLSRKEKRYFCRQCLVFPVSLAEAKRFEHRRFFLFMYVMFHLPLKTLFCKTVHSIGSRRKRNVAAS